jgi:hypothetical protein
MIVAKAAAPMITGRRWAWQSASRRDTIAYHNVVERRA